MQESSGFLYLHVAGKGMPTDTAEVPAGTISGKKTEGKDGPGRDGDGTE